MLFEDDGTEVVLAHDLHLAVLADVLGWLTQSRVLVNHVFSIQNPKPLVRGASDSVKGYKAGDEGKADDEHVDEDTGEGEHPQPLQRNLEGYEEGAEDEHDQAGERHEYGHDKSPG